MGEIFHIYASHGQNNYVELDLPASDYELLDMMERLRLEPGKLPYVEVLKIHETYDYLDRCIHKQPDIYQLNALARKLSEFVDARIMAAFEGLVGKDLQRGAAPIKLSRLVDFAYDADCCVVIEGAATDFQLGKFLVENNFIEEVRSLPDSARALLDFGKIGREHREEGDGVYTGLGYVEQQSELHLVSRTMDFQPRKPAYNILLNMAAMPLAGGRLQKEDMLQLRLPAPEGQIREAMEKLGKQDWKDVAVSIQDCAIPGLNHEMYFNGEMPQILERSQHLTELDARGELPKYKAILAANNCEELSQAVYLASEVDACFFEPKISSPEDVARDELKVVICDKDAETLMPYIDLHSYGLALLERDHAVITKYGLIEREGSEQTQTMEQQPGQGGMEMV